jgi:peptidoglycan/xylan/chitin deacetylase (PgdA/CDA1 family)
LRKSERPWRRARRTIDTTGGPGFGFEHFKQLDFLRDKEVVLTFDDGPWPVNTPSVLKTPRTNAPRRFSSRSASTPPTIRNFKHVAAEGHTVGAHTWSHANLNNKKLTDDQRKDEIERGSVP